jgi:DNA processing protein
MVTDLAQRHVQILSGGQYGIDAAAHRATMFAGGATIAVMSGSLDRLYPAENEDLLRKIAGNGGLLLSELPPGTPPTRHRMQERTRIMAALSDGVLVVEAGRNSSTFHTVREAGALNRPVGAVPGPVTSASSAGANWLIQGRAAQLILGSGDARTFLLSGTARIGRQIDLLEPDAPTLSEPRPEREHPHR